MAIDFGQVFRGVATGAMSAYNDAVVAKDRQYAELAVRAGDNYLNNILPETRKAEETRKDVYDRIASDFGNNFAELMDINKITTLKDGYEQAAKYYQGADKDALEAAMFDTSYDKRYQTRGKSFNEKYEPVRKYLAEGIGTMGPYTIDSLVGETEEKQPPMRTAMVSQKDPMTDTVTQQEVSVPGEFSSTAIRDFVDLSKIGDKDDKPFTQESQYRLRNNDIIKQAVAVSGLDAKFSTNPIDGTLSVTAIDEASQSKYNLLTERANNAFAANPTRVDYQNIGNEVATYVNTIQSLSKAGSQAVTNYFNNAEVFKNAPKTKDGGVDINSKEKVYTLKDGTKVDAFEVFERENAQLIISYVKGSTAEKIFIREQFGKGYSGFFDVIDADLEKQENS